MCKVLEVSSSMQSTPPKLPTHRAIRYKYAVCTRCGSELDPKSRYYCTYHKRIVLAQTKRNQKKRVKSGKCITCCKLRDVTDRRYADCSSCRKVAVQRKVKLRKQRIAAGLCARCGKSRGVQASKYKWCNSCRAKSSGYRRGIKVATTKQKG